ncbi:MAG TPA: hypothetical protein VH722_14755 [Alphaproteobacteria bacterium]|nr:hypothetical protein [Alphaproteobacteria bacterium]
MIGEVPDILGKPCEGLICEAFDYNGTRVDDANVVHLRFSGIWHRLIIDSGVIFWRISEKTPAPWQVEAEGWSYPHTDIGVAFGLVGQRLAKLDMNTSNLAGEVRFVFEDGRALIIEGQEDGSNYRIEG